MQNRLTDQEEEKWANKDRNNVNIKAGTETVLRGRNKRYNRITKSRAGPPFF